MFSEIKTLKVDNYALEHQQAEILEAIIKVIDEKLVRIRKTYCPKALYRSEQNLQDATKLNSNYDIEFYNYETNDILGRIRVIIKNIETHKNKEG